MTNTIVTFVALMCVNFPPCHVELGSDDIAGIVIQGSACEVQFKYPYGPNLRCLFVNQDGSKVLASDTPVSFVASGFVVQRHKGIKMDYFCEQNNSI